MGNQAMKTQGDTKPTCQTVEHEGHRDRLPAKELGQEC
jgi:hypothetical protein